MRLSEHYGKWRVRGANYPTKIPEKSSKSALNIHVASIAAYLEEVIFQEVSERLVRRNRPPCVIVQIQHGQHQHQGQGRQFRLVADGHQHHQDRAENVLDHLQHGQLESQQRDEHERQQNAAGQLQNVLRLVFAQRRHAGEQATALDARLGQHQQQRTDQRKVAQQKVEVPQDGVGDRLQAHDEEQHAARNVHFEAGDDQSAAAQLTNQIH